MPPVLLPSLAGVGGFVGLPGRLCSRVYPMKRCVVPSRVPLSPSYPSYPRRAPAATSSYPDDQDASRKEGTTTTWVLLSPAQTSARSPARQTATRASGVASAPMDLDFVSRRVRRHLNDLERTNYTEPTTGAGNHSQVEDADDATGAAGQDDAAQGAAGGSKDQVQQCITIVLTALNSRWSSGQEAQEDDGGSAAARVPQGYGSPR